MVHRTAQSLRPRRGLSLTEVLIALFVMAIGMISLLALFPIGISNMHWAMQDSRLGLAAAQALAQAESPQYVQGVLGLGRNFNLRSDPAYRALRQVTEASGSQFVFWDATGGVWRFDTERGAYPPVYVDPIGTALYSSALPPYTGTEPNPPAVEPFGLPSFGFSLGAGGNCSTTDTVHIFKGYPMAPFRVLGIPRIGISAGLTGLDSALRLCAQEDDMAFDATGRPIVDKPGAGQPVVQRERRYSWAYLCRWPRANSADVVDMSVVIYNARNLANPGLGGGPGGLRTTGEVRYPQPLLTGGPNAFMPNTGARFTLGSNQVYIYLGGAPNPTPSPWRPNDWILDNTLILPPGPPVSLTVQTATGPQPVRYWGPLLERLQAYPVPKAVNGAPVIAINGTPLPLPPGTPWPTVQSGLASGHFYRVVAVGGVEHNASSGFFQILTIDRPAKTDGYDAVYMAGVIQVIEKSLGRMPTR
jgi:hypothetical protein